MKSTIISKTDATWAARYPHDNTAATPAQVRGLKLETPTGKSEMVMVNGKLCHRLYGKFYRAA